MKGVVIFKFSLRKSDLLVRVTAPQILVEPQHLEGHGSSKWETFLTKVSKIQESYHFQIQSTLGFATSLRQRGQGR